MKHYFSELLFKLYLWTCGCTRDEYYDWIENNIISHSKTLKKKLKHENK